MPAHGVKACDLVHLLEQQAGGNELLARVVLVQQAISLPHPNHALPQHDKVEAIFERMLLARCGVGVRGGKLGVHAL